LLTPAPACLPALLHRLCAAWSSVTGGHGQWRTDQARSDRALGHHAAPLLPTHATPPLLRLARLPPATAQAAAAAAVASSVVVPLPAMGLRHHRSCSHPS
jgi:hypothetical protein